MKRIIAGVLAFSVVCGLAYGGFHFEAERQLKRRAFLCVTHDISKGTLIKREDLGAIGGGELDRLDTIIRTKEYERFILDDRTESQYTKFIGKPAKRDIKQGEPLTYDDGKPLLLAR